MRAGQFYDKTLRGFMKPFFTNPDRRKGFTIYWITILLNSAELDIIVKPNSHFNPMRLVLINKPPPRFQHRDRLLSYTKYPLIRTSSLMQISLQLY